MMARLSEFKPVPKLMEWPLGSSRGEVSSTGSRRTSRPILGSRSSPDRAMPEPGDRSMWLVCWMGSCGRRLAMYHSRARRWSQWTVRMSPEGYGNFMAKWGVETTAPRVLSE